MSDRYFWNLISEEEQPLISRLGTFAELEALCLSRYADRMAVHTSARDVTYRELWADVAAYRRFLKRENVGRGEKIAVVLPNSLAAIETFLAAATYGAVAVMVSASGPLEARKEACGIAGCEKAFALEAIDGVRTWKPDEVPMGEGIPAAEMKPEDPVAAFFTGGTSGIMKCALLSNRAMMTGAYNGIFGPGKAFYQRYYGLIPFSHIFGTVRNLLSCLQTGSQIMPCENMSALVADLKSYKPTLLVLIPALAGMLLGLAKLYGKDVFGGELKLIVTGGAPQPTSMVRAYRDEYGIEVVSGYGLTETANLVSGNVELLRKEDSVGKLYEFQEIRFADGEIELRGENIFLGYINNPEETAASFDDGWFRTGDIGYMDEDGYLYITGRIKNIIYSSNGEKIFPEQIESKMDRIPGVKASMVSMKENKFGAKVLTCEIFADPKEDQAAVRTKAEAVNNALPDFCKVRQIVFRAEDFPRTASMKIRRG